MSVQGAWSVEASRAAALQGRDSACYQGIWKPHPSSLGHTSVGRRQGRRPASSGSTGGQDLSCRFRFSNSGVRLHFSQALGEVMLPVLGLYLG